jgi:hypothetical protein
VFVPDGQRVQSVCLVDEPASGDQGRERVDQSHPGDRDEQQGAGYGRPGVEDDLESHLAAAADDREHRYPCGLILAAVLHRQRPVVRRGPKEDDQEKDERGPGQFARDRGPADEHRHAAGNTAPDDVLRGAAFEHQGVEDDIEQDRTERQQRGQPVRECPQPHDGHHTQDPREHEGLSVAQFTRNQRPVPGAVHDPVDIAVDVAVEGTGRPGAERAAD